MSNPDFIFRKYKENYSIKLFLDNFTCFHGEGKTITEALDSIFNQTKKSIPEVKDFIKYLDERDAKKELRKIKNKNEIKNEKSFKKDISVEDFPYYEEITCDIIALMKEDAKSILLSKDKDFIRKRAIMFQAISLCGLNDQKISYMMRRTPEVVRFIRMGICSADKKKAEILSNKIQKIVGRIK